MFYVIWRGNRNLQMFKSFLYILWINRSRETKNRRNRNDRDRVLFYRINVLCYAFISQDSNHEKENHDYSFLLNNYFLRNTLKPLPAGTIITFVLVDIHCLQVSALVLHLQSFSVLNLSSYGWTWKELSIVRFKTNSYYFTYLSFF